MAVINNHRSRVAFRFWNASLAWHRPHEYAGGMTNEQFCRQVRDLCDDPKAVGYRSRMLLDDYIHGVRFHPLDNPGELISLPSISVNEPMRKEAHG